MNEFAARFYPGPVANLECALLSETRTTVGARRRRTRMPRPFFELRL
jgi:hypothetical protein